MSYLRLKLARGCTVPVNALQTIGGFPISLVIFAGIALFLVLRLRSVLGKRVGFERPPLRPAPFSGADAVPTLERRGLNAISGRQVPDPSSDLGTRLMQIVNRAADFDPPAFLQSAEAGFRTIVLAFAAGDRAALRPLLTDTVFQTFDAAISARESANERHQTEIKSIISATIEDAQLLGDQAAIIVRFISDQTTTTQNAQGDTLHSGDSTADIVDLWTFERNLKSKDPIWRLAAARSG